MGWTVAPLAATAMTENIRSNEKLAAKTLAMAATAEGHQVLMSSHYGGEMRGGQTEASVVIADEGLRSVPILESVWSAYVMHARYWPAVADRLRPGGVVVANSTVVDELPTGDFRLFPVPAGQLGRPLPGTRRIGIPNGVHNGTL